MSPSSSLPWGCAHGSYTLILLALEMRAFPTAEGCAPFAAGLAGFEGKQVSWDMHAEGHSEQVRLFLILLHSHMVELSSLVKGWMIMCTEFSCLW